MIATVFSVAISATALVISLVTAWLTFFRKGKLDMTQPTMIFIGPDVPRPGEKRGRLKVMFRTLLFSTSQRGQMLQSMHVSLQREETRQNFSFWAYGSTGKLTVGSGLFVGREGNALNHHFVLPSDGSEFSLLPGRYTLQIFAHLVHRPHAEKLTDVVLTLSKEQAEQLQQPDAGIFFEWGPSQQTYYSHVETRPPEVPLEALFARDLK